MASKLMQSVLPSIVLMFSIILGNKIQLSEDKKHIAINIAVGSLIALLSLELVPMIHEVHTLSDKVMTIVGVISALLLLNSITHKNKKKEETNKEDGIKKYIPLFIGLFLDGFIIGIQKDTQHGNSTGIMLALALSIDNLLVGMGIGASIGNSTRKLIMMSIVLGLSVILGTVTGMKTFKMLEGNPLSKGIVSFGVTALMWETYQELMPETKSIESPYNLFGMYIGFLLVFIVNWVV